MKNFELRHKSFRGFLDHWNLDIAAFQVRGAGVPACCEGWGQAGASSGSNPARHSTPMLVNGVPHDCVRLVPLIGWVCYQPVLMHLQEVKLPAAKVTKELACVDGFQVASKGSGREAPSWHTSIVCKAPAAKGCASFNRRDLHLGHPSLTRSCSLFGRPQPLSWATAE